MRCNRFSEASGAGQAESCWKHHTAALTAWRPCSIKQLLNKPELCRVTLQLPFSSSIRGFKPQTRHVCYDSTTWMAPWFLRLCLAWIIHVGVRHHLNVVWCFPFWQEKMKGKNKLVPRLLGITKESVMRVDEKTKDVVQEWPLTTVKRWAASPKSFTLVQCDSSSPQH